MPLRPVVMAFAEIMEEKLLENEIKGGWADCSPGFLLGRLDDEVLELIAECRRPDRDPKRIVREAADVANFAMMVADVCGGLE